MTLYYALYCTQKIKENILIAKDKKRIMTELLGLRTREDLSMFGEADLWMEKWQHNKVTALVMQDDYKLMEFWQRMPFCSFESCTVCNICLTHWNHLINTLTINLSVNFLNFHFSPKFQIRVQLLPIFLYQDVP